MSWKAWFGFGIAVLIGAGCGGGQNAPSSYSDISISFAHPTGTVSATSVDKVAKAYKTSLTSGLGTAGGRRLVDKTSASQSIACPNGGSMSFTASSSGSSSSSDISETFSYNNCCEAANCCFTGGGNLFYSSGSYCESFSITGTCLAEPVTANYSICMNASTDTLSYLVEVDSATFVVSGSYSNGSGTLTIIGQNGTYTCAYTNDTGSCTSTSGTFTF